MCKSGFFIYKTIDNKVSINVQIQDEKAWLTQEQMVELFGGLNKIISEYTGNLFDRGELDESSVVWNLRTIAKIAIFSVAPNSCVENSGFPNFMEVA